MVEVLIYIGLLTIFTTIMVEIFTSILKVQLTTQSTSALTQDSRFIMSRLAYDLGNASAIAVPADLGQTANSLQFTGGGVVYTYSLDANGNLLITSGGISSKLNGLDTKINSISFHRVGNPGGKPTVQVIFTLESLVTEQSGVRTQTLQTTYGLR